MTQGVFQRAQSAARFFGADLPLGFKNLLLPAFCRECGIRILTEDNLYFCSECWGAIELVREPKCPRCGRPHSVRVGFDPVENFICSECSARKLWVGTTHAAGLHVGVLRDAIHLLKFGRKRRMAQPLARLLFEHVVAGINMESYDAIAAVPLHRNRRKERGYNQSELIAECLCGQLTGANLRTLLRRVKDTPSFSKLGASERHRQIRNAFKPAQGADVKKKKILLVDDVVTTGATTNECARTLRRAGATTVDVVAVAAAKRSY